MQGDAERLKQLLAILLHNALEHTPPGTAVTLRLCAGGAKAPLSIAVADNGPGIADADKAKIFERFYRADPSRTDKQHCGLGLAVAQELARLHGAALRVSDDAGRRRDVHGAVSPVTAKQRQGVCPAAGFLHGALRTAPVLLKRAFPAI